MGNDLILNINKYVEKNIVEFHKNRIDKLNNLKFLSILKKKNPYLINAFFAMWHLKILTTMPKPIS